MDDSDAPDMTAAIAEAQRLLGKAQRLLVLTGAGISADSGIPTFRDPGGYWAGFDPETLSSPEGFRRDPCLVWRWYEERRKQLLGVEPNPAHLAVARLALARRNALIVTQNVDGLHERAARTVAAGQDPSPALPIEFHGSLFRHHCSDCGAPWREPRDVDAVTLDRLPRCDDCGGLLRPSIVWFGEAIDDELLVRALSWTANADCCLVIGTSGEVDPAASMPWMVRSHGGSVIEVNPQRTLLTRCANVVIRERAAAAVPKLIDL
jgi:NAD-dependent deacetylase